MGLGRIRSSWYVSRDIEVGVVVTLLFFLLVPSRHERGREDQEGSVECLQCQRWKWSGTKPLLWLHDGEVVEAVGEKRPG